jgi:hypothetical protein
MTFVFVAMMLAVSSIAFGADAAQAVYTDWAKIIFVAASIIAAGLCMGIGATGAGSAWAGAFRRDRGSGPQSRAQGKIMLTLWSVSP